MRRSHFKNSSLHRDVQSPVRQLRLVLLGRTGSGKSATGNTILDKECFLSKMNRENRQQVKQLLKKLDELLEENKHRHFTNRETKLIEKALAMLEQKKQEKLDASIKKAKQEVRQIAECLKADIEKALETENQEIERRRSHIQDTILSLTAEINKENENLYEVPQRLQVLQESLNNAKISLRNLEKEKELRTKESEEKKKEVEKWMKKEQQSREQEHPEMIHSQFKNSSLHRDIHSPVTQLQLVLLGRTGSGKSATGNTILNQKCFLSKPCMGSVTKKTQKECGVVQDWSLAVIDTPGWFDTADEQSKIAQEVRRCLAMCLPGPHVFLLIIPIDRFTEEQQQTVDMIEKVFKGNFSEHTIIIFTRADGLEGESIEQFISEQDQRIQDLIARFGGRFLAFNNKNPENREQVYQLLKKIDGLQEKLSIMKAKQEVCQIAERRKADIIKALETENQAIERRRSQIQGIIISLTAEINKEIENLYEIPQRLQVLQESLQNAKIILRNLGKEKTLRVKESEEKKKKVEKWMKKEEQKREQEEREKALKEDEKKWYYNEKYMTILKYLILFLGGAGAGFAFAPALFMTTAAPVGIAAELSALLGPKLAATVMAAATKAAPLIGAASKVAPVVTSLCSIQ